MLHNLLACSSKIYSALQFNFRFDVREQFVNFLLAPVSAEFKNTGDRKRKMEYLYLGATG